MCVFVCVYEYNRSARCKLTFYELVKSNKRTGNEKCNCQWSPPFSLDLLPYAQFTAFFKVNWTNYVNGEKNRFL